MEKYILKQINTTEQLNKDQDRPDFDAVEVGRNLRQTLRDVELKAVTEGYPEIVDACQMRDGPISISIARLVLSQCLALAKGEPVEPLWFNVKDASVLLSMDEDRLSVLCKQGSIECRDDSKPGSTRRAFKIPKHAIESYTPAAANPKNSRRRKATDRY